jgi:hypothetical protein
VIWKPPPIPPRSTGGLEYRMYFLDGAGHIEKVHEFEARDDDHAIKLANGLRENRRIELWQGSRLLLHWD